MYLSVERKNRQNCILHSKHSTHPGNVPDMVLYPGNVALLNKYNWEKTKKMKIEPMASLMVRL